MLVGGQLQASLRYPRESDPVPILQEAVWNPGPAWTCAENIVPPSRIRSPDRPTGSESLYRLHCLGTRVYKQNETEIII